MSRLGLRGVLLVAIVSGGCMCLPGWAQRMTYSEVDRDFLHVDNPIGYTSYALDPYDLKPSFYVQTPRFDRMGNYLTSGELVASLDEPRPGLSTFGGMERGRYSVRAKMNYAVQQDSYRGVAYKLLVLPANPELAARQLPEGIRTRFSPLTMNVARYAGLRFDAHGRRNHTTLIYSRGASNRLRFSFFTQGRSERSPVILWGGHWQSQLGAALRLGTTFVNQHITDTTVKRGSVFSGNLPYEMQAPKTLTVRVTDDSPEDESSAAAAYAVAILLEVVGADGEVRRLTNDAALSGGDAAVDATLRPEVRGRRVGSHYEAAGPDERIEFVFTLPAGVTSRKAEFVAQVAGDYRLGCRQTHDYLAPDATAPKPSEWPAPASALGGRYEQAFNTNPQHDPRYPIDFKFPETDPSYTVARAEGNHRDLERIETVRFEYGMPTAQNLVSADFSLNYGGYTLDGELAANVQNQKFTSVPGERSAKTYRAFFLNGAGPVPVIPGRWQPAFGAEVFAIPAAWSGGYDARRGGSVFFTDVAPWPLGPVSQEFNLYDDNDDGDQWEDDHPNDSAASDSDDAGVFPGQDANDDRVIDTDQNSNGRPDWAEPFLSYNADPPEFLYDVDFNNNGLPDMTENDDEPDYPYRRGQRGYHFYLNLPKFLPGVGRLSAGFHRIEDVKGGGESRATYLRLEAQRQVGTIGRVTLTDLLKWVKDDIPDPSYTWKVTDDLSENLLVVQSTERATQFRILDMRPPAPDLMSMRNSTVNTLYLRGDLEPLAGLEVRCRDQLVLNRQHETAFSEGGGQASRTVLRWTLSNGVRYMRSLGHDLTLGARGKHLLRWDRGYGGGPQQRFSIVTPAVDAKYQLSKESRLVVGQEGFPLLPFRYIDHEDGGNSYTQRTTLVMGQADWMYWGWSLTVSIGMQWQTKDSDIGDLGERVFFLESYVGF